MSILPRPVQLRIETLLNDIAWKFQLTQSNEVFGNLLENALISLFILQLQNVLHQVITIWIFDQVVHMFDNVIGKFKFLSLRSFFETPLHDTTPMFVHTDFNTVLHTSIKDELCVLTGDIAARQILLSRMLRGSENH